MSGLKRLCKIYGSLETIDSNGNKVVWVWDYANDKPVLKDEMTQEQLVESERAKWGKIKEQLQ